MRIGCKWNWHNTGHQVWYNKSTYETLKTSYPLYFYDDFLGVAGGSAFAGTMIWDVLEVGDATSAVGADGSNGHWLLHIHATDQAEDAVLDHNDNKTFDIGNGLIFEAGIDMSIAVGTGVTVVAGMAGDHDLVKDSLREHAWFRWEASMAALCETDDGSNNNDDVATGVTCVAGTLNIFRIDFTTITDVKFFIDGVRVGSATTFDMSTLNAAGQQMQPYFSMEKTSGGAAAIGDMKIDYVKIWSNRS